MCGIVACIGDNCSTQLYNGIVQLKNRGYDSVGICTLNQSIFIINKYASTLTEDAYSLLEPKLLDHIQSKIGIAHTRWATHGAKTDLNSHPHQSSCGKFVLVHNGIIENYKDLKLLLLGKGYRFMSDTDTEVIVQLLSYIYSLTNDVKESIKIMTTKLTGTWGLAILCLDTPDTIYCVRHGSPILVGYDDNTAIIASEQSGFCNMIQNYFVLNNHDICIINKFSGRININTDNKYKILNISRSVIQLSPAPYKHWTLKEIYEQGESALRAISMGGRLLNDSNVKLGGLDKFRHILVDIDNLIILGCGTSFYAGQHGSFFFKDLCHFNIVNVIDGADFTKDDIPKIGNTALLFISQSGETKDLHRCIEIGKQHNLFLIGLVNVVDSLIAREVDCGCYLNAGREVGVASTKSYTSQVILLSLIAVWFSQNKDINHQKRKFYIKNLRLLPNDINNILQYSESKVIKIIDKLFLNRNSCFLLGKGKSHSVAKEGALKIKEISYIHAEGYSTSALKHGPFALLNETFPVIILAPNDDNYSKSENAYEEIKSRNAPILFITDRKDTEKENVLLIPENNTFRDLLSIIPLQLVAYQLSIRRGINPDMPKNLAKVVTVE